MYIQNGILDIIIYYLNPHEIYLEELKYEIEYIRATFNVKRIDLQYLPNVIIKTEDEIWGVWRSCFSHRSKLHHINILKKRKEERDEIYGIVKDSLFINIASNSCHMSY